MGTGYSKEDKQTLKDHSGAIRMACSTPDSFEANFRKIKDQMERGNR